MPTYNTKLLLQVKYEIVHIIFPVYFKKKSIFFSFFNLLHVISYLDINVIGLRLLSYRKNMWLRTMCCLQIIWQENRKSQWRSWSAAILHGEDVVQAGCD